MFSFHNAPLSKHFALIPTTCTFFLISEADFCSYTEIFEYKFFFPNLKKQISHSYLVSSNGLNFELASCNFHGKLRLHVRQEIWKTTSGHTANIFLHPKDNLAGTFPVNDLYNVNICDSYTIANYQYRCIKSNLSIRLALSI